MIRNTKKYILLLALNYLDSLIKYLIEPMPLYYFAAASQNFLIHEEPIEEILRERTDYYKNNNKSIDFWFIKNPSFIQGDEFRDITKQIPGPIAAIVSLDELFITWLKLRIGFIIIGNFNSTQIIEAR